ncbi:MAG: Tol-Pal system beta propeller repeat protein TolB, partial [Proteobacteria bacterium]|nr:Tol-Pal system beta propeller repeat protein TolB [Pseudomonadota bacterium]
MKNKGYNMRHLLRKMPVLVFLYCLGIGCFSIPVYAKDITYINISNPLLKKTPIAVTEFKAFNGQIAEVTDGKMAQQILGEALDFTGYLKTMNPVAFLSNPAESGIEDG